MLHLHTCMTEAIIDIAVRGDFNAVRTEDWKVEKYQDLAFEIKRIHHVEWSCCHVFMYNFINQTISLD